MNSVQHRIKLSKGAIRWRKATATETSLSELALQSEVADHSHFSRIFRRWAEMTPKA